VFLIVFELRFAELLGMGEGLAGFFGMAAKAKQILAEKKIAAAEVAIGFLRSVYERDIFLQRGDRFLEASGGGIRFP
jgi:hypothetical protein